MIRKKDEKRKKEKRRTKRGQTIILAAVLAVAAWFLINIVDNPETTVSISDIDVHFKNEFALKDKELVLTGKDDIPSISVVLRGRRSDLMSYMNDVFVEADTAQVTAPGEYKLTGTVTLPSSNNISVETSRTVEIPITAEKLETKEIPVEITQTGTNKTKIIKSEASAPTVTVTGSRGELDAVASAAVSIDVSEITEDNTVSAGFVLADKDGGYITQNETLETKTTEISVVNTVYTAKTIKIEPELSVAMSEQYMLDKDDTAVTPSTVTVGTEDGASPESIVLYIDKPGSMQQEYTLQSTDAIYVPKESSVVKVRAVFLKKATQTLTVTPAVENVGSGLSAAAAPVSVTVTGPENELTENGVKAAVDAAGLTAGVHTLPVKFGNKNITASEGYTAEVTIQ